MKRYLGAIASVLAAVVAMTGCGAPSAGDGPSGEQLVSSRCTACHGRERIDLATHDRAGWEATVGRMRSRGARLTDEEAQLVIDHLSARAE